MQWLPVPISANAEGGRSVPRQRCNKSPGNRAGAEVPNEAASGRGVPPTSPDFSSGALPHSRIATERSGRVVVCFTSHLGIKKRP